MFPQISIILLNWNGWRDTIECLESLYQIAYPNYDVIVVDNGSKDSSIQKIKEYAEGKINVNSKFFRYNSNNKPIKVFEITEEEARQGKFNPSLYKKFDIDRRLILIKNKDNYGFAGGNNIGIKFALSVLNPDYILLLNNDTVVDRHFLNELVKAAKSEEKIGIVGPKIYYYDTPKIINSAGAKVHWHSGLGENIGIGEVDEGQYDKIEYVEYTHGACMLIKSKVFHDIGLLDERFFILLEDADFCIRAKERGYNVLYYPYTKIYHKEGASRGRSSARTLYFLNRNRILLFKKHRPQKLWYITLRTAISPVLVYAKEKKLNKSKAVLTGVIDSIQVINQGNML